MEHCSGNKFHRLILIYKDSGTILKGTCGVESVQGINRAAAVAQNRLPRWVYHKTFKHIAQQVRQRQLSWQEIKPVLERNP